MTLSKGELNRAEREAEKIQPDGLLWHNTKILRDGETYQRKLDHGIRVQYIVKQGVVEILRIFKKTW